MESFFEVILSFLLFILAMIIYRFKGKSSLIVSSIIIIIEAIIIALNTFWLGCYFFTGEGINQSVIYTLTRNLTGVGLRSYWQHAVCVMVILIFLPLLTIKFFCRAKSAGTNYYTLFSVVLVLMSVMISPTLVQLLNYNKPPPDVDGSDFLKFVKVPQSKIPSPKYNLVYIYGESFERTYFDAKTFPGLLPDLAPIIARGIEWSGTEQYPGMDFTIAGIVASQCGLPLFTPAAINGENVSGFFPDRICLGDILKKSGFETWFIQGADLHFADKNKFFSTHGIDNTWGLKESGLEKMTYKRNEWGLYDDEVMDKVWQQFEILSRKNKQFALFTLTLDTHPPKGYLSPECHKQPYRKNGLESQGLTAVLCSQQAIAQLIKRIQSSPWSANTVIVISSDHLLMPNMSVAVDYLNKMKRENLFVIIKPGEQPRLINGKRSPLDNGATVLEVLGGDNAIGLGRSSLSQPSLATQFPDYKNKLLAWGPSIRELWSDKD